MKLVVTSTGASPTSPVDPRFGRCPFFAFVDPDRMEIEAVENVCAKLGGGAGVQAAQFVLDRKAEAVQHRAVRFMRGCSGRSEIFIRSVIPAYPFDRTGYRFLPGKLDFSLCRISL